MLLLGGFVVVVSLGGFVVLSFFCFLFFLDLLLVVVDDCEVLVCDCGCSEIELVEPLGLVEGAVAALGGWLWGGGVVWLGC